MPLRTIYSRKNKPNLLTSPLYQQKAVNSNTETKIPTQTNPPTLNLQQEREEITA